MLPDVARAERQAVIDAELAAISGVHTWTETVTGGATLTVTVNDRLLSRVLPARRIWLGLRMVRGGLEAA